ncbi:ABC transporter permease [Roseivirga misakiensis]|uniref:ABC transporter permease n=1 Tax=Roseivirga misakiensis TaxID=1563681 RepID=A0A1E5SYY1_9BACT|nr:ABC transporter permease [Roseivirga misakiensis]OEK04247.1 hypothetical protein BFP71_12245 [Roseivirga misakiensis]
MNQDKNYIDPPKSAERFFEWYCQPALYDSILGDLYERFDDNVEQFGARKAKRKFWFDVIRFINRHTLKKSGQSKYFNNMSILNNYFKVGFRNLIKNRSFTAINVLGLSVSMAVCLVIILMINDQLSYDNWQVNSDKTYRFTHNDRNDLNIPIATVPMPLGEEMHDKFAGFEHMVTFRRGFFGDIIQNGKAIALQGYFTEPSFFELFSFELERGNPKTALSEPNSIVLKKDIAEKLFKDQDPMGQSIEVGKYGVYQVTGVLKEFPGKTHIKFESLVSMSSLANLEKRKVLGSSLGNWNNASESWIYFKLRDGYSIEGLQAYLTEAEKEHYEADSDERKEFEIQKMSKITPGPLYGNQIGAGMPNFFVIGLGVLAILIIICATFNYTNLSAARALTRTKEVGVRKVMGAKKTQLTIQFIVESILVSVLSLCVAIGLLQFLIPAFENLQMSALLEWELRPDPKAYLQFFAFSVLLGLITGIFPSLYLASFKPIQAMKNSVSNTKLSRLSLRKALIVTQFVISIVLIVSSVLVYKQIKFMVEKDYGFTKENILNVHMQGQDFRKFETELEKLPFIESVTATNNIPGMGTEYSEEAKLKTGETFPLNYFDVDEDYISSLELELIAGRNFLKSAASVNQQSVILNETAVDKFGFESSVDAVGEQFYIENDSTVYNVVGVVKDYNYMMLVMDIGPMMLRYDPVGFRIAQIKIAGFDRVKEITAIEDVWDEFDPNHEIILKTFQGEIDEFNALFYDILYIVGLVAILSISIAGMGLLGISTYAIQIRMKEVSIRKVLGASVRTLIFLLSKSLSIMLTISFIIGFSLAYMANNVWLNQFAYRTSFGVDVFFMTALAMTVIGAMTIGWQAWRATKANPATTLRDD